MYFLMWNLDLKNDRKAERVGKGPAGGEEQRIKIQVEDRVIIKPIIVYVNKILSLEKPLYRYH